MINITYTKHPYTTIYNRVTESEAITLAQTKQNVVMFVFDHKPTRIAMVTLVDGKLITGAYND